ncbi:hypothetical protein BIV25_05850 [Streptomyces sp. MUSC 14]|uniref:thioredoxin domain-containing protein n=1 Tax=Streptomyces sp. MUSC 14 TaxID=1354889 RepID=UPI0008F5CE5F|nr:thioredoxin domain-containing protein [Streptomyces sp. MUSC 14]OIK01333.1 hypothetical protein BIV25_05850 [Streptomyces sp. MUSC 14]
MAASDTDGRRTARDRMRSERDAAARRARLRRRALITAGAVAATAVGAVYLTTRAAEDEAAGKPLIVPANTAGQERTSMVYGKLSARHTLTLRTALGCPSCRHMEDALGPAMRALADRGTYRIEYQVAASPDGVTPGREARHALNALGAAANADAGRFTRYLRLLLGVPPGGTGTDDGLLHLADEVDGLRTPAFDKAVKEGTYLPWVNKMIRTHRPDATARGVPSADIDSTPIALHGSDGAPLTAEEFTRRVGDLTKD